MSHTTTVNDNAVELLENQRGGERDTNVRRFAADCERNHEAIHHLSPGAGNDVNVMLVESGVASFHPPDGWELVKVFIGSPGWVVAKCRPEVDA